MALPLPSTLSPSKVSTFRDCALAFRFGAIDRLPEPPSVPACKGTFVHRVLELLFCEAPADRTPEAAEAAFRIARDEYVETDDFVGLALDDLAHDAFFADAQGMVDRYFGVEDPTLVNAVGLELMMEARVGDVRVRGIIDRLDLTPDGQLIVTDYKTGRVPSAFQEQQRLQGVHFYSLLCEEVLGQRPAAVQLMYLSKKPEIIVATPSQQSTNALRKRVSAIWTAIERACELDNFRPQPGPTCNWCSFQQYCPAFGGDPSTVPTRAVAT